MAHSPQYTGMFTSKIAPGRILNPTDAFVILRALSSKSLKGF